MKKEILLLVLGALVLTAIPLANARVSVGIGIYPFGYGAYPPPVVYPPDPYYYNDPYYYGPPPAVYFGGGYWGGDRGRRGGGYRSGGHRGGGHAGGGRHR